MSFGSKDGVVDKFNIVSIDEKNRKRENHVEIMKKSHQGLCKKKTVREEARRQGGKEASKARSLTSGVPRRKKNIESNLYFY